MKARIRLFLVGAMLLVTACGGRSSVLVEETGPAVKQGDATARLAAGDALWKNRADRKAAEAAIKAWEEAAATDPTRADIQLKLAYANYFLANAHLRWDDDEDGMLAAYDKSVIASERALKLTSPDFARRIRNGEAWEDAIPTVGKEGIPAMYWYASSLGKWALLDGFTTILSLKDRVAAIMTHVQALDPECFHGGTHRYFGVYRTKIPFPGGDLPASKKHFEEAIRIGPDYLDTKVLYAENYAVKAQDKALFVSLLESVIAAPDDKLPDLVPETRNSKRIAKKLLEEIDDNF